MALPEALTWAAMLIVLAALDYSRRPSKEWRQSLGLLLLYLGFLVDLARWRGDVPEWIHMTILWVFALAMLTLLVPLLFAPYMGDRPEATSSYHHGLSDPGRAFEDERREQGA